MKDPKSFKAYNKLVSIMAIAVLIIGTVFLGAIAYGVIVILLRFS